MNNPLVIALMVAFGVSSILIIGWMINMERRLAMVKRKRANVLGFSPLPHPSPDLVNQILALYPLRPGQRRELRHIFIRRSMNVTLVMFDLYAVKGESTTLLAESAIAAVFDAPEDRPSFPGLSIMPRLEGDKLQPRANPWLLSMALAGQRVIAFADVAAFTGRFTVLINETSPAESLRLEGQVRRFLSANLRTCLSQLDPVQIEARDNFVAVSSLGIACAYEEQKLELTRRLIDEAVMVAGWFESEAMRGGGSTSASDPTPTIPVRTPAPDVLASAIVTTSSADAASTAISAASRLGSDGTAPTVTPIEAPFTNGFFYRVVVDRPASPPAPAD